MAHTPAGPDLAPTERGVVSALADLARLVALPSGARLNARVTRQGGRVDTVVSRPFVASAFENALAVKGITAFALPRSDTLHLFREALEQSYLEILSAPGLEVGYQGLCDAMGAYAVMAGIAEGQSIMATAVRAPGVLEVAITWPYTIQRTLIRPPLAEECAEIALRVLLQFPG